jgi:hypothetical protein
MKSKEEIEQLAENSSEVQEATYTSQHKITYQHGYIDGYTQCQEDMAKESIAFANFLKADFEMEDSGSSDDILWLLCGTKHTYTTDEIYDEFIKSRSLINSLNKQV